MKHIALAGAAFAFAIAPSALTAQQTSPDQQTPQVNQSAPSSTTPPPFPPFTRAPSHRWVDVGDHHKASTHHHAAPARHHAAASESRHGKRSHHKASAEREQPVTASKKTIRRCHNLTYKQIMQQSTCRALMKQDLEASDRKHSKASHHRTEHHNGKHRDAKHKDAKPHQATHRHSTKRHRQD